MSAAAAADIRLGLLYCNPPEGIPGDAVTGIVGGAPSSSDGQAHDPFEHSLAGEATRIYSASKKNPAASWGGEETGWSKRLTLHPDGAYEWYNSSYSMDTYDYDRTTRVESAAGQWVENEEGAVVLHGVMGSRKDWDSFNEYMNGMSDCHGGLGGY